MTDRFKSRVLQHVAHRAYQPQTIRDLADQLGIAPEDRAAFEKSVADLIDAGQVVCGASQTLALPPMGREVSGKFKLNDRGFGFVIPESRNAHGDLFIPVGATAGALTGDLVLATVQHTGGRGPVGKSPYVGKIVRIIERGSSTAVGTLDKRGSAWVVVPDGKAMTDPIVVRDPGAKHAVPGDKVVVDITRYPEGGYLAEGVITQVIGRGGEPDVETDAIIKSFGLPEAFPEAVVENAREIVRNYERNLPSFIEGRRDLRDTYIITIDPPNAQDYDDAISIQQTPDGIELGVHIADVATFVTPGNPLDDEGYKRGNSVYLPRRVIPMLPEILSNGICSLQPGVPRLTISAFMTYNERGEPTSSRFARSIIHSAHRLTYLEAQFLIDGQPEEARKHAKYDAPYTDQLIATLHEMNSLARTIRKRRLDDGMIVLDLPEVELIHDDTGRVVDAQPEDDSFTHKLIEMFMVEANEAVARVFADLNVPMIRRIHPEPTAHDTTELKAFAHVAGYNIPQNPTRKELQQLLDAVRGTPAAKAVHYAVLRTLTRAQYAPDLIGHFALTSEHYTHFTSPIRRYPDLYVHRALHTLMAELGDRQRVPRDPRQRKTLGARLASHPLIRDEDALRDLGRHCSGTERNAETAERELRNLLVMQLLSQHLGEDYPGTVTGVTSFGIYVQIDKYLVEGMIRTADLPGGPAEQWRMNKITGAMVAQRSGRVLNIGDQLTVRIIKVDLSRREMDLMIIQHRAGGVSKPMLKAGGPSGKPGKSGKGGKGGHRGSSARPGPGAKRNKKSRRRR
jgi:ribonuclease R